jgi:hypothetical protein
VVLVFLPRAASSEGHLRGRAHSRGNPRAVADRFVGRWSSGVTQVTHFLSPGGGHDLRRDGA